MFYGGVRVHGERMQIKVAILAAKTANDCSTLYYKRDKRARMKSWVKC